MVQDRKLVLVALDGSDQSMEAVKYVNNAVNLSKAEIVLVSILGKVPDLYLDWQKDEKAVKHGEQLQAWDAYKEEKLRECMEKAAGLLEAAGVAGNAVTLTIQRRKQGVARDLISECKYGYDAVVFGRSGLGRMDEAMMGSIASKMFINVADAPVCMVGRKPTAGKILVGMDSSLASVRVVNFVGRMLCKGDPSVTLLHVIRTAHAANGELELKEVKEDQEQAMKPVFEKAVRSLKDCGFKPEKIATRIVSGVGSRARAIFDEAKKGKYGTIVVGRRGHSDVQEFTMGQVAYKLGQVATNMALWLIP
ncbi:MAG: universal stress protein [Syntrophobacteraceae bacterium]|jgi:nucleotide-binding universal stress UspA family protein